MSTQQNNSRHYYVSNENMSEYNIKESIEEYSMNFQKESIHGGSNSRSRSEIAEMISGSQQATQSRFGKSRGNGVGKGAVEKEVIVEERDADKGIENSGKAVDTGNKPINLGDKIYKIIHQRYHQVMKISTDDPQVLYDFYTSQRRHLGTMKQIKDSDIEKQMPSMQRKLIIKQEFQKILTYFPQDVYYTLVCQAEVVKQDRLMEQKVEFLNRGAQVGKGKKVTEAEMNKIVQKLYNTKGNLTTKQPTTTPQQLQKHSRKNFGKNLSEHFQNLNRSKPHPASIQTPQKLHTFWQNLYEREQFGIEWPQQTAKQTIQQYMYEQVEDLMAYANRKLGFKCGKAISLLRVYQENLEKIQDVWIPMNSFQEYVKVYNGVQRRKAEEDAAREKEAIKKMQQDRKKKQVKKFGRPVSATPITVLSKPKTPNPNLDTLLQKYPQDKLIKTLLISQQLKKPRHPNEYGLHNIEQEIKLKQWVKIDPKNKTKYQDVISNKLVKTFTQSQFQGVGDRDRDGGDQVMALLGEEEIWRAEVWKEMSPVLQEAMLVKAHECDWFRDCIIRYLQRITNETTHKLETNQKILQTLFTHLHKLPQSQKSSQLQKLQTLISTSETIAQKAKMIHQLTQNQQESTNKQNKERRLLYALLEDKAVEYVRMRIRGNNGKFMLRAYLKELFGECCKEHKEYVRKFFNVVEGDKECPKLLKYQFFRIVKEINPITLQRQRVLKNHAWVPPKQRPQNFNYKTHNTFSQFYTKDRNIIVAQPQDQKHSNSLWGRKKTKQRQNLLMTYQDAKQCTFQPKYSKKV